ncbi:MAG TPA: DUF4163 domain-containing protein [Brevundimonas sp.]|uniref:DUF3298 and DUF4163 domain-containing protein n=1 Tax=Brevundimonas sp. TaxID=1871086 RepID=UPI002DF66E60|nr:DUF4163 domain-containing protein [Brevundimonas sp.]
MTARARFALIAAAVLTLSACNRDREPAADAAAPAAPGAAVTPAEAAAPLIFSEKTAFAKVDLKLPEAIKAQPDLHAKVYAQEVAHLREFAEGAQADNTEAGAPNVAYEQSVELVAVHETGKLMSLKRTAFEFTGGAHPNTVMTGVLWDKALKRQIGWADVFTKGADFAALDRALCAAINAAKRERVPDAEPVTPGGKLWACPRAAETPFVLAPGTTGGKAGGLIFLIGPYQVGPYAEGPYEVTVPLSAFQSLLAPAYADEFAGAPAKAAVTPTP